MPMSNQLRAFAIGWACGGRTSYGTAALALTARNPRQGWRRARTIAATASALGELVVDKLPMTPSRLDPPALAGRITVGAATAGSLAFRDGVLGWVPVALGAAGTTAGSFAGATWRRWAVRRVPDWQAALAEDALTALVAFAAARR